MYHSNLNSLLIVHKKETFPSEQIMKLDKNILQMFNILDIGKLQISTAVIKYAGFVSRKQEWLMLIA